MGQGVEPVWRQIMRRLPLVCPRCSRRFPRSHITKRCADHTPAVKLWDQADIIEAWD